MEVEVLGGETMPVSLRRVLNAAPADRRPDAAGVTVVTQCSVDRLPRLQQLAKAWGGAVSAAVYVEGEPGGAAEGEVRIKAEISRCNSDE
jgi:hypothetical protein